MTNGEEFQVGSTYGKPGDRLILEVDPTSHVAWTRKFNILDTGRVANFNKKFTGLGNLFKTDNTQSI